MNLRKWHRWIALISAPFLLVVSCSGMILMLDTAGVVHIPTGVFKVTYNTHTWGFLGGYIGIAIPLLLIVVIITGLSIWIQTEIRKRQARKKKTVQVEKSPE